MSDNKWSIYSIEELKPERQGLKAALVGKKRAHSFLALVDESKREIVRELHFGGYATDGAVADRYASNPMNILATLADSFGLSQVFKAVSDKAGIGDNLVRLKGVQTGKRRNIDELSAQSLQLCMTDAPEKVLARWNAACKAAVVLNEADIPTLSGETVIRPTVNCRSGTRMALEAMELPATPVMADYKPGWERRLRDEVPGLSAVKPETREASFDQLMAENLRLKNDAYNTRPHARLRLAHGMNGASVPA